MTVSLEFGIGHLLPEFPADALVFLTVFQTAGTVAAGALETFFHHLDHFLIFVQSDRHNTTPLFLYYRDRKKNVNLLLTKE